MTKKLELLDTDSRFISVKTLHVFNEKPFSSSNIDNKSLLNTSSIQEKQNIML